MSDFSKVVLLPVNDQYTGGLNALYRDLKRQERLDFWSYFRLNHELLGWYAVLSKRVNLYLFTAEYIQEDPAVKDELGVFKEIISAARLNLRKSESQAYASIVDMIGVSAECILYIDDKQQNCDVAHQAGMTVVRYESNGQIVRDAGRIVNG